MKNNISALTEQLTDVLNNFAESTNKQAERGYKKVRPYVNSMFSDASDRGGAAFDAAQNAAYSLEESLEETIQERPLAAVAIALGVGFILGAAWKK